MGVTKLEKKKKPFQDPNITLQAAIEDLELFTQPKASRLEVSEEGRLVAAKEAPLKRVMSLARAFMGPLFSGQARRDQERKLGELKQALLNARDIIQSHSALILKLSEGNETQRKLAQSALSAIQRYNAIVGQQEPSTAKFDVYNYERQRLLHDQDIQGRQIELPHTLSIKYESHPDAHPAYKTLKQLGETFLTGGEKKEHVISCPKHKKNIQFMIDTFRMKGVRLIQAHLSQQNSMAEIVQLVHNTPLEIDEEAHAEMITMQQLLEVGPGFFILVSGCFNRSPQDPQFLTLPLLDSFRLSVRLTHSGYPYPSQRAGWTLGEQWVEANPLRAEQVPFFHRADQRKKQLSRQLLSDHALIQKGRKRALLKKQLFDQNRDLFLPLHRQLQQALRPAAPFNADPQVDAFYREAAAAASPYDFLVQTEQKLQELFIKNPLKILEEEWLGAGSGLRIGSPQEKFHLACQMLEREREKVLERLDETQPRHAFIRQQGVILGHAFQSVALQYQSEKMGFSPPLLSDFERKLQAISFQQLLSFMDECDHRLENDDSEEIKEELLAAYSQDLKFLRSSLPEETQSLPIALVDELEVYFNARFYSQKK